MEKKKLLLVAISVGVVLLIVISVPLMVIAPRQAPSPSYTAMAIEPIDSWNRTYDSAIGAPVDIHEMMLNPQAIVDTGYAETVQSEHISAGTRQVTTITVRPPETAAVPTTTVRQVQNSPAARPAPAPAAKPAPVARAVTATPKETAKPAQAPAARPSTAASSSSKANDYWVQTGAFSTKIRAEGAKESLASKGITSIIDNRDIDGKTWYRVRVGPYTSETEATYWLALVKAIDGFGESQIRQTQAVR
ncbi:MAG: SPOR domain-containing protein [Treponema sp.]|nr:SPOR domain-containing protein [Treponema sp.]